MSRRITVTVISVAIALIAAQLIPVDRSNPPVGGEIQVSSSVLGVLRQSCYDCHSNETNWPWYSYVAPISWMTTHHVREGRAEFNFSTWNKLTDTKRAKLIHEIWEETSEGKMPLRGYLIMHPEAKVSEGDLETIRTWSESFGEDER